MTEANKALVKRFFEEVWNQHRIEILEELLTDDFVWHEPYNPDDLCGIDRARQFFEEQFTAFPDYSTTIEDLLGEGDRIALRWLGTGTHRGVLKGLQPTGNTIAIPGISILHCRDGKIAEYWSSLDNFLLLSELGAFNETSGL